MKNKTGSKTRLTAVCLICILLLTLLPQTVFAASLKTVYVVSSIAEKGDYSHNTQTFAYDRTGKLKSFKGSFYISKSSDNKGDKATFSYSKDQNISNHFNYYLGYHIYDYFFTWKKNKLVKGSCFTSSGSTDYKYTYTKGKITKAAATNYGNTTNYLLTYDKKGRLASLSSRMDGQPEKTFAYDKKGNLKKVTSKHENLLYTTTYKSGRAVKIVCTDADSNSTRFTVAIKYKKIKLSAAAKKITDKQQKQLLFNYAYRQDIPYIPFGAM